MEHLEVGLTLLLPVAPTQFLDSLLAHKGSRFYAQEPPARATCPLLVSATHHDYRIKAYDKGAYNRVQGIQLRQAPAHLLRFEVVYTRARPLQRHLPCSELTLATLLAPAVVQQLAQALRQHWYQVEHRFEPDFAGLAFQDMLLLHAATAPALWQAARQGVPARTLRRYRARSRQLRRQAEEASPLAAYHQQFEQQLASLLGTPGESPEKAQMAILSRNEQLLPVPLEPLSWPVFHACNQVESSSLPPVSSAPTSHPTQLFPNPSPVASVPAPPCFPRPTQASACRRPLRCCLSATRVFALLPQQTTMPRQGSTYVYSEASATSARDTFKRPNPSTSNEYRICIGADEAALSFYRFQQSDASAVATSPLLARPFGYRNADEPTTSNRRLSLHRTRLPESLDSAASNSRAKALTVEYALF